jgi:hypothetical protein
MTLRLAAFTLAVACSSNQASPSHPTREASTPKAARDPAASQPVKTDRCIPPGRYAVQVDLSTAHVSQKDTGMEGTEWCRSMLEAVPAHSMASMTIAYPDGRLAVEWSGSKSLSIASACEFEITSPPMPVRITFAAGRGHGTTTYSIGTANHPDESCTATGATIRVQPVERP